MSISSIASGSAVTWPSPARQTKSASAVGTQADDSKLAVGMNADAPYDAIKVDLPNGMIWSQTPARRPRTKRL
jgi:hypothetical protein